MLVRGAGLGGVEECFGVVWPDVGVPVLSLYGERMVDSEGEVVAAVEFFEGKKCVGHAGELSEDFFVGGVLRCEHEADTRFVHEVVAFAEKIRCGVVPGDCEDEVAVVVSRLGGDCAEQVGGYVSASLVAACRDQLDHFGVVQQPGVYALADAWFDGSVAFYCVGLLVQWACEDGRYELVVFPVSRELAASGADAASGGKFGQDDFWTHFFDEELADVAVVFLRRCESYVGAVHSPILEREGAL